MDKAAISHDDRAQQLSSVIQANVDILTERTAALNTEPISIDGGVSQALQADAAVAMARRAIAESTAELQTMVKGPETLLMAPPVCCST